MSVNIAIVRGVLSSDPECRTLPSGSELAQLQVTTRPGDGAAVSVPVSLADPPAWVATLGAGDEIVAAGCIRRRFFRAAGATASRVELAAVCVARTTDKRGRRRLDRLVQAALEALEG